MQRRRTTLFGSILAGVLSLGLLTGCAGQSDYPLSLASKLQTSVQLVTQLASDGEYQAALTALQNLRADLAAAQKDGTVDADRVAEIEAAIAAVSKDLKTKIGDEMVPDAEPTPSHDVETSQAPAPVPQDPVNPAPVNPVPAPEAPAPAPVPEPVPSSGPGAPTTPEPSSTPTPEQPSSSPPQTPPPVEETSPEPIQPPPSSTIPEPKPSLTPGMPGRGVQPPPQSPPQQPPADDGSNSSGANADER